MLCCLPLSSGARRAAEVEVSMAGMAREAEGYLLDLILQLGYAVHMRQFLQHDAAF